MVRQHFNRAIKAMLFADSLILIATAMLAPIYALFVERIGGDLLDAGITFGAFSLAAGIVTLVSGTFTDRVKQAELIIVLGYIVTALGFISYIFVDTMVTLVFAQIVVGIGTAIRYPAFDAVFSSHLDKGEGGREGGAWEST